MENKIRVIDLAKYESPIISESKKSEWVEYGSDNNYYQYLIDRYTYSSTNNAVINNIVKLIYGKGLAASNAEEKVIEYAQFLSLINSSCVKKVITDVKLLGQGAFQVIKTQDKTAIAKVYHIPVQLLRPEKCNEEGDIEAYYYSDNWQDVKKYPPKRIPVFGSSDEEIEILYIQPYSVGMKYFSLVDYQGSLPYALLEQEISDYLINEVQNGFSGTKVINFNNGVGSEEEMDAVESKVISKLTGSKGKRVIVSFNDDETKKTTVDDIPLNNAPDHYTYLSEECTRKILLGHNVTSPLLFGISSTNGFGSNADELKNSFILYYNLVIKPYQDLIIEYIDKILSYNGISLNLYFDTLKPLEFSGYTDEIEQAQEEETAYLSKQDESIANKLIELGEDEDLNNWLLIDEYPVDYETDDQENKMLLNEVKLSLKDKLVNLVSTGYARPNITSKQDKVIDQVKFITRYVYAGETTSKSRPFCKKMISANKIYRKEDIVKMSEEAVNEGWGPKGASTYDIWKYKGGGSCHHRWNKRVYATFSGKAIDVNSKELKQIAVRKAEELGYVVKNDPLVSTLPVDMPYNGFLPSNPRFNK